MAFYQNLSLGIHLLIITNNIKQFTDLGWFPSLFPTFLHLTQVTAAAIHSLPPQGETETWIDLFHLTSGERGMLSAGGLAKCTTDPVYQSIKGLEAVLIHLPTQSELALRVVWLKGRMSVFFFLLRVSACVEVCRCVCVSVCASVSVPGALGTYW